MSLFNRDLEKILGTQLFCLLFSSDSLKIAELNLITNLLIKAKIPFDTTYSPGTRREAAAIELTIYINPSTTLSRVISLQAGGSIFSVSDT